jgi:hypothetical protein
MGGEVVLNCLLMFTGKKRVSLCSRNHGVGPISYEYVHVQRTQVTPLSSPSGSDVTTEKVHEMSVIFHQLTTLRVLEDSIGYYLTRRSVSANIASNFDCPCAQSITVE